MRVFAATAGRCRLLLTHTEASADQCVPELVKSVESGKNQARDSFCQTKLFRAICHVMSDLCLSTSTHNSQRVLKH